MRVLRETKRLLSLPEYSNHDVIYTWQDTAYSSVGDLNAAINTLMEGLDRCPRKNLILHRLGVRMLDLGLAGRRCITGRRQFIVPNYPGNLARSLTYT
jgi:hypothetical protein